MYEQFYGLKDKPFSMMPDPSFLYLSKKHQAALTLLEYGLMNNVGFCVISGETGAGKTTLLRKLLGRIDDSYRVGMITNTHQSFGSLLDWVLSAFNQHEKGLSHVEMHQKLMDFLIAEYAKNRKVLLIVDEAQNMNAATLEELRMLSNVNSDKDQLMQVILAGQPALKDTLRIPELMQFAQRIGVDYHLGDLDVSETTHYIQHRLHTAGAIRDIFTAEACARIHSYSGGTPRLVNLLCDTVMVYGFADQREIIDVDLIDEMVTERMKDSVVPLVNRDSPKEYTGDELKELNDNFPSISDLIENERSAHAAATLAAAQAAVTDATDRAGGVDAEVSGTSDAVPPQRRSQSSAGNAGDGSVTEPVNKVEILEPEMMEDDSQWWLYGVVVIVLALVLFFIYKSNLLVISGSSFSPLKERQQVTRNEQETIVRQASAETASSQTGGSAEHEYILQKAEQQKLEDIATRKARQERADRAAAEVTRAMNAAALEPLAEQEGIVETSSQHKGNTSGVKTEESQPGEPSVKQEFVQQPQQVMMAEPLSEIRADTIEVMLEKS